MKEIPFVSGRYCVREGTFFLKKKNIQKGKELDLRAELPRIKLCCGIPPIPGQRCFLSKTGIWKSTSVRISKTTFSLFKSVTGDHLGFLSVSVTSERVSKRVLPEGTTISPDSIKVRHKN